LKTRGLFTQQQNESKLWRSGLRNQTLRHHSPQADGLDWESNFPKPRPLQLRVPAHCRVGSFRGNVGIDFESATRVSFWFLDSWMTTARRISIPLTPAWAFDLRL